MNAVSPRVFVVNEPLKIDRERNRMVRFVDLTPAEEFGCLVHLLPPGEPIGEPGEIVEALRRGLSSFTEKDYLLLVGDPCAIGWAAAIAADAADGRLNYLRWIRGQRRYEAITADVYPEDDQKGYVMREEIEAPE